LCELLTHLPLSNDSKNRKIDSVKEIAAISEYIKNCTSRETEAEPMPEDKVFINANLSSMKSSVEKLNSHNGS